MANVAILYCKKIQDHSCIACAKCHKGMAERHGEFSRYGEDELQLIGMTDCGDCPGLTFPRVKLLTEVAKGSRQAHRCNPLRDLHEVGHGNGGLSYRL